MTPQPPSLIEQRALGAYLGLACGDALGATVEFLTRREIEAQYGTHCRMTGGGWLKLKPGQITDDTSMSIALGQALLQDQGWQPRTACEKFAAWLKLKPPDVGNTCRRGIRRFMTDGSVSTPFSDGDAGNGAVMRLFPIALVTLYRPDLFTTWCLEQCHITHNHPLSDDASLTIGKMVQSLILGGGLKAARDHANALIAKHKVFRFDPYRGNSSAYVVDTIQTVFHYFFRTDQVRSCLIEVVNQGGDADTTGAIAGMLAGAAYGVGDIPQSWLSKLDPEISQEIRQQVSGLLILAERLRDEVAP